MDILRILEGLILPGAVTAGRMGPKHRRVYFSDSDGNLSSTNQNALFFTV